MSEHGKKHAELKSQLSAENQNNSSYSEEGERILEREKVKGSPFWIIGNEKEGYALCYTRYRFTEMMKTKEEVIEHLATNQYDIILQMILATVDDDVIKVERDWAENDK